MSGNDPCPGAGVLDPTGVAVHVDLVTCIACNDRVRVAVWRPGTGHLCPGCARTTEGAP